MSTEEDKQMLWHYTSKELMIHLLEGQTDLALTHYQFQNDKKELMCGIESLMRYAIDNKNIVNSVSKKLYELAESYISLYPNSLKHTLFIKNILDRISSAFLLCFSKQKDLLSQWRGYAPHGGCCIGFVRTEIEEEIANDNFNLQAEYMSGQVKVFSKTGKINGYDFNSYAIIGSCVYNLDEHKKLMDEIFNSRTPEESENDFFQRVLLISIALRKHSSFVEENEVRVVYSGEEYINPSEYQTFNITNPVQYIGGKPRIITFLKNKNTRKHIKEIIISPGRDASEIRLLAEIFKKKNDLDCTITGSFSPYIGD